MKRRLAIAAAGVIAIVALLGIRSLAHEAPLDRLERVSQAETETYRGSWYFPRGGPSVVGTQCSQPCTLSIDGRVRTRGTGVQLKRVVLDAGFYAVELTSTGGEPRLLWHPTTRRGPPEYVPASSLSPQPPASAERVSEAGTSRLDGVVAIAIFVVIVMVIAMLLRGVYDPVASERARWLEVAAVFAIAAAVRLIGLGDAGQTWDEDVNWSAGRNYITNLLELDFSGESWIWNLEHPPLMKYMVGMGAQLADGYGPARAISALMMAASCALLVPIASRLHLGRAGLFAGLVAALSPHLVGHGQIVGHESAMALTWMLAITAALCVWPAGARTRLEVRLAICGAAVGLAIASRFVNGLVGPLVYLIVVFQAPRGRRVETAWKGALIMPAAAIAVFVLLWPRMWQAPIDHLGEAWRVLKKPHSPEPFLGEVTNVPPRSYFAIYLVATAPLGLLVSALAGLGWLVTVRRWALWVVALWLLIPMVVMFSPVRQDGIRYIVPSLFALALLAGIAAQVASEMAVRLHHRWGPPLPPIILALYLAFTCAQIRPYFINYYGEHTGGPARVAAAKRFEIAWWGEGLDQALEYLNKHAEVGARVYKRCVAPSHLAWMRYDLWKGEARSPREATWALVYSPTSRPCPLGDDFELVHEVTARGAPLARVYRRR